MDRRLLFSFVGAVLFPSCAVESADDSSNEVGSELRCRDDENPCTYAFRSHRQCSQMNVADGTACPGGTCHAGVCEPSSADDAGAAGTIDASMPEASSGCASGACGIAAKYPGDVGIADDPDVLFADGFESYASPSDLWQRWTNVFQMSQTRITTAAENVWTGSKALEFTLPQQNTELSNAVVKALSQEVDELYLRFHSKFESSFDVVGSSHNGAVISAHYQGPGIKADGTNHFLAAYECWRGESAETSPGRLNVYLYHPEQRDIWGDHLFPTGIVMPYTSIPYDFGPEFVARPDVTPELGRWYVYEYRVRANTPGKRDGRITLWLDGQVLADFPNLRLRDIDSVKIDQFSVGLHAHNTPVVTRKWYDNVVAARRYIGPVTK
jgi:hypothetical protein